MWQSTSGANKDDNDILLLGLHPSFHSWQGCCNDANTIPTNASSLSPILLCFSRFVRVGSRWWQRHWSERRRRQWYNTQHQDRAGGMVVRAAMTATTNVSTAPPPTTYCGVMTADDGSDRGGSWGQWTSTTIPMGAIVVRRGHSMALTAATVGGSPVQ